MKNSGSLACARVRRDGATSPSLSNVGSVLQTIFLAFTSLILQRPTFRKSVNKFMEIPENPVKYVQTFYFAEYLDKAFECLT